MTAGAAFRALWEDRDLEGWLGALDDEVELHSPLITMPFVGRATAAELYGVLLETLTDFEIVEELSDRDSYVCYWLADVGSRRIEGADFIRSNSAGKVTEVRVLVRPLVNLAAFASGVGPALAAKRGRFRAVMVRILNLPLRLVLGLTDVVAPLLIRRR